MDRAVMRGLLALLLIVVLLLPQAGTAAAADQWRQIGPASDLDNQCIDGSMPTVLLAPYTGSSSYYPPNSQTQSLDWSTGVTAELHPYPLTACTPSGLLFSRHPDGTIWRFTTRDSAAVQVERLPTHYADDGSLAMYSFNPENHQLWFSSDGGSTWSERGTQFGGRIDSFALAAADASAIYAQVRNVDQTPGDMRGTIYFSADSGQTWEQRASDQPIRGNLLPVRGAAANTNTVLRSNISRGSSSCSENIEISTDGGRSWQELAGNPSSCGVFDQIAHTPHGWLRVNIGGSAITRNGTVQLSTDSGNTWRDVLASDCYGPIKVAPSAPWNVFYNSCGTLYHSTDGGQTWSPLAGIFVQEFALTPYLPLSIIANSGDRIYSYALPDAGNQQLQPVAVRHISGERYFPQTGHHLAGPFRTYWEHNGGLEQFGYPRTEVFRELNPADGFIYSVQYFERNRFEYHPENRGTTYEVLLGLLGSQFTAANRAAGDAPFQPVAGATKPDAVFFPETGHTLRGAFRPYWQQYGGLAIYGYPISEEFVEYNEDDGHSYIVQYFERARFEYHPENKGTKYEVLLGLLGNKLLREKGWSTP